MDSFKDFLAYELFTISDHIFTVREFVFAFLFLIFSKLSLEIFKKLVLRNLFKTKNTEEGTQYSINRLLNYCF